MILCLCLRDRQTGNDSGSLEKDYIVISLKENQIVALCSKSQDLEHYLLTEIMFGKKKRSVNKTNY